MARIELKERGNYTSRLGRVIHGTVVPVPDFTILLAPEKRRTNLVHLSIAQPAARCRVPAIEAARRTCLPSIFLKAISRRFNLQIAGAARYSQAPASKT